MKNLDLNKYGVQAMDTNEMKKTDGGSLVMAVALVVVAVVATAIDYAQDGKVDGHITI